MVRRSSRLAGSTSKTSSAVDQDVGAESTAATGNYEDSEMDYEESDEEPVRPKKRQKQSRSKKLSLQFKNVRGRRGALKDIVEMPLDILQEIFLYLTPVEVLSLSRMCKALRRILMTKSAECIWRQARFNLDDFPDCPDDLNEVQFASLIFGALCDYCNKNKGRYFIWSIRRCCCGACITNKNGLIQFDDLPDAWKLEDYPNVRPMLPSINPRSKTENLPVYWERRDLLCEASALRLLKEFKKYHTSDFHTQYAWIHERSKERERRITHGRLCGQWLEKQNDIRVAQLDEIRQRRYEAIKQRLADLGWGKEIETIRGMADWPSVRQPKDLTDRIWQNIKDDIIAKMEEHRAYRLEQDYLAAQRNRRDLLRHCLRDLQEKNLGKVICPDIFDLESTEPISALIKAPAEETIEFPESLVSELVQNWRQSCDTELRNMVIAGSTPTSGLNDVDPLLLATTLFSCWRKCGPLPYPEVLMHKCATLIYYSESCLWNADGNRVSFDGKAYSVAKTILEASGLNPETTTRVDVQWPAFYIECHGCPVVDLSGGKRFLMTWPMAFSHPSTHVRSCAGEPRMARADLSDAELRRVQKLAAERLQWTYKEDFLCVRCKEPRVVGSWSRIKSHIRESHREQEQEPGEPVLLTDYILQIGPSGFCRQPHENLILGPEDD